MTRYAPPNARHGSDHCRLSQHWILDGFPRTLEQGRLLDTHLEYVNRVHVVCLP